MIRIKFRFIFLSLLFSSSLCGQKISSNNWNDYIAFYRKFGSPLVGGNCQMLPSCSKYADIQFTTNNAFAAFLNTSDRLIRCSHDVKNYQVLATTTGYRFIDFPTDSLNKLNSPKWNEVNFASVDDVGSKNELFIENLINRNFYSEALLEINRVLFENDKNQTKSQANAFENLLSNNDEDDARQSEPLREVSKLQIEEEINSQNKQGKAEAFWVGEIQADNPVFLKKLELLLK